MYENESIYTFLLFLLLFDAGSKSTSRRTDADGPRSESDADECYLSKRRQILVFLLAADHPTPAVPAAKGQTNFSPMP